jgi:hypothetical protein
MIRINTETKLSKILKLFFILSIHTHSFCNSNTANDNSQYQIYQHERGSTHHLTYLKMSEFEINITDKIYLSRDFDIGTKFTILQAQKIFALLMDCRV